MRRTAAALAGLLALVAGHPVATGAPPPAPAAAGWQSFEGTWSASGRRLPIEIEGDGSAVIVEVSGAIVLAPGSGLSRGFQGRSIGYDDGQGLIVGRSVWTDDHGDRIYSRVRGEQLATGRKLVGTITGGTGRYAGLEGEYSLTWQYLVEGEDGAFQVRAVGLTGRFRRAGGAP
ncbi:MAG: hypothetical protein MUF27_05455 [Acidobacteria bacterium]|jgi:hypothetical protein|nr:hypothetical protein [Acidobacteriota bacterium]